MKKAYGKQQVLDGLSFEVKRGSIFALLGENGAGKTTMVRILSTLIHADSGKATIAGFDCRWVWRINGKLRDSYWSGCNFRKAHI